MFFIWHCLQEAYRFMNNHRQHQLKILQHHLLSLLHHHHQQVDTGDHLHLQGIRVAMRNHLLWNNMTLSFLLHLHFMRQHLSTNTSLPSQHYHLYANTTKLSVDTKDGPMTMIRSWWNIFSKECEETTGPLFQPSLVVVIHPLAANNVGNIFKRDSWKISTRSKPLPTPLIAWKSEINLYSLFLSLSHINIILTMTYHHQDHLLPTTLPSYPPHYS